MEINVVVKICDHANMIGNYSHTFSNFGFTCGASKFDDAMFFIESCYTCVRIIGQEAIPISLIRT